MRERLSIVRELAKRGYRVIVPVSSEIEHADLDNRTHWASNARRLVEKAGKLGASALKLTAPIEGNLDWLDFTWLRDKWTQLGEWNFIPYSHGWPITSKGVQYSVLGIGGKVVNGRNFVLVHEPLMTNRLTKPYLDRLREKGWKVYGLPTPSGKAGLVDAHIDLDVGVAPAAGGRHVMVASKDYLSANRERLEKIALETNSRIVEVPAEEKRLFPANFLVLPDGKVLMTGGAPKTKAAMERHGVRVFTTIPLTQATKFGGGLRCLTNTFYPRKRTAIRLPQPGSTR